VERRNLRFVTSKKEKKMARGKSGQKKRLSEKKSFEINSPDCRLLGEDKEIKVKEGVALMARMGSYKN